MKLSKKLLIRELDVELMASLTKAIKMKREKTSPSKTNKRQIYSGNMNMTSQNIKQKPRKIKDRVSPQSGIFQGSNSYIKASPTSLKRPSSVEGKKHE
jgi:hypothetical protein